MAMIPVMPKMAKNRRIMTPMQAINRSGSCCRHMILILPMMAIFGTNSGELLHNSPRDYVVITDSRIGSPSTITELAPKIAIMGNVEIICRQH